MLKVEIKSKYVLRELIPQKLIGRQLCCHYTKNVEYYHVYLLSIDVRNGSTTTRLRVVRSTDWDNRAHAHLYIKFYHSYTNIYSFLETWNQWLFLHWYNLIWSYQHIWKPLTLQWCTIGWYWTSSSICGIQPLKKGVPKTHGNIWIPTQMP